jgi:hypothetical protein
MGASSSVVKSPKSSKERREKGRPGNVSAYKSPLPQPLELTGFQPTSPKKKSTPKHGQRHSRHSKDRRGVAEWDLLDASARLSVSAPITTPSRSQRVSRDDYSYADEDVRQTKDGTRAASAPPTEEQMGTIHGSGLDFFASPDTGSPRELQRVPEMELRSFRRIVTSVNLKADAEFNKTLLKRKASVSGQRTRKGGEEEGMQWLESHIPYVGEQTPSAFYTGSMRRGFSFAAVVMDDAYGGDTTSLMGSIAAEDYGDDAVMEALAALQGPPDAVPVNTHTLKTSSQPATAAVPDAGVEMEDENAISCYGSGMHRMGTFGLLMPTGNSVVIRRGRRRRATNESESGGLSSQEDLIEHFLLTRCTSDSGANLLKAPAATERQHEFKNDFITEVISAADVPATALYGPPQSRMPPPPPPHATTSKSASRRSYPLPQPAMYGPRSRLTRSRPFNIERVLGFAASEMRRVPSPDWRRLNEMPVLRGSLKQYLLQNGLP